MPQKYHTSRLITNDLYFAATLMCQGARLERLIHNGRRRISFEFVGEDLQQLKVQYERDEARVPVRSFRDHLLTMRRRMDAATFAACKATAAKEQRSTPCPQSPMKLSPV